MFAVMVSMQKILPVPYRKVLEEHLPVGSA